MPDAQANEHPSEEIGRELQAAGVSADDKNDVICPDDELLQSNNPDSHIDGMKCEDRAQNFKRQLTTDSDSDRSASTRRTRLRPCSS